jgi:hypothetical protein
MERARGLETGVRKLRSERFWSSCSFLFSNKHKIENHSFSYFTPDLQHTKPTKFDSPRFKARIPKLNIPVCDILPRKLSMP